MESEKNKAIEKMYDLFVEKVEQEFNVDKYSSNYELFDGSLTLVINGAELHVNFVNEITVILNFWKRDQQVIPICFENGEWYVNPYSDWNDSPNKQIFDENYLNRIIRQFKFLSQK